MIVYRSLNEIKHQANSFVTVGTFDGVHLGHRAIINQIVSRASASNGRSIVVTFDPHPREVVGRGPVKLLSSIDERLEMLSELGVDGTLVVKFTYEFSRQTSQEFYEQYVVRGIGVKEVVIGYDHMFGRDREAGVQELQHMGKELGFSAFLVPPVTIDGEIVNSSKIRELLSRGNVERAAEFLSAPYSLEGTVVHGDGRGVTLGFPTANIRTDHANKITPAEGVYVVRIVVNDRTLYGMFNIGVRPTFHANRERVLEAHIFDFNETIYGAHLKVSFLKRLRPEKKFSSTSELIAQLESDRSECLKYLTTLQPS